MMNPQRPLAARLLPSRWYYGWVIVFACGALLFVSVGVGYYGLAVYLGPLQDAHGWSNGQVSLATGLYFAGAGLAAALVGPQIDRHGARGWIALGLLFIGGSSIAIGYVDQLWQLYLVYIGLSIGSGMSAGVAVNATLARWFLHRRAWAMAMSSTGVSLGGAILSPVNAVLIETWGLNVATPVMGALILVVGIPIVAFVLVWDPRQMGLPQDGFDPPPDAPSEGARSLANQTRQWTMRQATGTPAFWAIMAGFVIVLLAQTGFLLHQPAFLTERLGSLTAATFTLSLTAIGSIVARLIVGRFFADRVDLRVLTVIMFVVQGAAGLVLVFIDSTITTWIAVLVFGFTIGNVYMLQSLLTSDVFGFVSFGAVYGLIAMATQISSGVGPWLIGLLHDATGEYTIPLAVASILTFAALLPIYFARPPRRRALVVAVGRGVIARAAPQHLGNGSNGALSPGRTRSGPRPFAGPPPPALDPIRGRR